MRKRAAEAVDPRATELASLFKKRCNHVVGDPNGTTVLGFRTTAGWEFWYQTWATGGNAPGQILRVEKFYP